MIDQARKFLGQTYIGSNQYDRGQCVGLYNVAIQDHFGQPRNWYPIQGATTAFSMLTANNTRPDLCTQVINDPKNPNQLPSVGDWMIWNTNVGGGAGHVACVESVNPNAFTSIDQNWVANKVTRENHNWQNVAGWIHFKANEPQTPPPDPCAGVKAENEQLKAQNQALQTQVNTLVSQLNEQAKVIQDQANTINAKQTEIDQLSDENTKLKTDLEIANTHIKDLEAQLAVCGGKDLTINFNIFGNIFWALIKAFGTKSKGDK